MFNHDLCYSQHILNQIRNPPAYILKKKDEAQVATTNKYNI